nr:MAG TPA: hypothetical protein [Caudoviricetes sp.]
MKKELLKIINSIEDEKIIVKIYFMVKGLLD